MFLFGIMGIPRLDDFTDTVVKGNVHRSLARTDTIVGHGSAAGWWGAVKGVNKDVASGHPFASGRESGSGRSANADADEDDDDALANPAFEYMMRHCSLKSLLVSEICLHTSDVSIIFVNDYMCLCLAMSSLVRCREHYLKLLSCVCIGLLGELVESSSLPRHHVLRRRVSVTVSTVETYICLSCNSFGQLDREGGRDVVSPSDPFFTGTMIKLHNLTSR